MVNIVLGSALVIFGFGGIKSAARNNDGEAVVLLGFLGIIGLGLILLGALDLIVAEN